MFGNRKVVGATTNRVAGETEEGLNGSVETLFTSCDVLSGSVRTGSTTTGGKSHSSHCHR